MPQSHPCTPPELPTWQLNLQHQVGFFAFFNLCLSAGGGGMNSVSASARKSNSPSRGMPLCLLTASRRINAVSLSSDRGVDGEKQHLLGGTLFVLVLPCEIVGKVDRERVGVKIDDGAKQDAQLSVEPLAAHLRQLRIQLLPVGHVGRAYVPAILLRILARAFGVRCGLGLSAVFFGLAHLSHGGWLAATGITINAGFTMSLPCMATGRLWMSIGMHTAWDLTEDSILGVNNHNGLLLSTPVAGKSALLTGGTFGPDASVLATMSVC